MSETRDPCELYRKALQAILNEGKVCAMFTECDHRACQSSYTAWAIADEALREATKERS